MQDLRDRLKSLGVKPITRPVPEIEEEDLPGLESSQIFAPIAPARTPQPDHEELERLVPGRWEETPHGKGYVIEQRFDLNHSHGKVRLDTLLNLPGDLLAELGRNQEFAGLDTRKLLFFDTETTGLAGGTGTYVFLNGVGFFENEQFVVRQLFMPDLESERAVLHMFNDLLTDRSALVSFNGRSFDWPLIEARFTMSRMRLKTPPPHLDLLSPARRVWKEQFASCSLGSLEGEVLRFKRQGDVPGWLIPTLYFQYLRERRIRSLQPVFEHNRHDILSMLALIGHMVRLLHQPDEADLQSAEYYGLGRLYEDLGQWNKSVLCYERALRITITPAIRALALQHLITIYRRLDQRHEGLRICEDLVAGNTTLLFPYIELAKHYEHQARDYATAETHVRKALEVCSNPWNLLGQPANARADLDRRLRRLQEKKQRQETIAARPAKKAKTTA